MDYERPSSLSELARLGFESLSETLPKLEELVSLVGNNGRSALSSISISASPDSCLKALISIAQVSPKTLSKLLAKQEQADRLCLVLGASDGLAEFIERHPEHLDIFAKPPRIPAPQELAELSGVTRDELRIQYRKRLLQIADFDLSHQDFRIPVKAVMAALSDLASGALESALRIARLQTISEGRFGLEDIEDTKLSIIAMGKCGARELNYVSDVDVIYVVKGSNANLIPIGTRLASVLAQVIDEPSMEPGLWQVDPNLRPEGKSGALVRTLEAHVAYYEKWAQDWEFQALLKARFVAGDKDLGVAYEQAIRPLIWSRSNRAAIVENSRNMRKRVLDLIPAEEKDREIKLGRGGLRDVEFTVQLLQLVHGVADESVRTPDTLSALESLALAGLIGRSQQQEFQEYYLTLRSIEHRVQLVKLRRTHLLPVQNSELRRLARALNPDMNSDGLLELWRSTRLRVGSLHDSVYYQPLLTAMASLSRDEVVLGDQQVIDRLNALGFLDPAGARRHIAALTSGVSRRATIQRTLLPVLIRWMAEGTDPDRALLAFRRLSESLGESHWFLRMVRDSTGAAERLMKALSTSGFVARMLEHIPEASEWFGEESSLRPISASVIESEMMAIVSRDKELKSCAEAIRTIRRREVLRVAMSAVLGVTNLEEIMVGLTEISESYLRAMLAVAKARVASDLDFGIVVMGRLGGSEVGFGSDADAMLIYSSDSLDAQAKAEEITRELQSLVKDSLLEFDLDLGLRPEGKNGPVVKSIEAYQGYYEKWADLWEFQALLRARIISGSPSLQDSFTALIDKYRYEREFSVADLIEIKRVKARVENERLPLGANPARHLKLGKGSLSDIEWLVQLLQMRLAGKTPELRLLSTVGSLIQLEKHGAISKSQLERLTAAWMLSSRIRSAIVLALDKRIEALPEDTKQLESIARILEYPEGSGAILEEDYLAATRKARLDFEQLFYA